MRLAIKKALTVLMCTAMIAGMASGQSLAGEKWEDQVKVTAHRGDKSEAPENTLPAFKAAIERGADWIELDVTQTKDGTLVVLHDEDLIRVAGRQEKIWEVNYEELRNVDLGTSWGPFYKNTPIPRLEEALDYCKGKIKINIEIKSNGHESADFIPQMVNLIKQKGMSQECMLTSFNYGCIQMVKVLDPSLVTGFISSHKIEQPENYTAADKFVLSIDVINPDTVGAIHALGKEVVAWTVNDQYSLGRCRNAGVDNIITDKPGKILEG